jgi:hypothetical protein
MAIQKASDTLNNHGLPRLAKATPPPDPNKENAPLIKAIHHDSTGIGAWGKIAPNPGMLQRNIFKICGKNFAP